MPRLSSAPQWWMHRLYNGLDQQQWNLAEGGGRVMGSERIDNGVKEQKGQEEISSGDTGSWQ